jgi:hypothetical protein
MKSTFQQKTIALNNSKKQAAPPGIITAAATA